MFYIQCLNLAPICALVLIFTVSGLCLLYSVFTWCFMFACFTWSLHPVEWGREDNKVPINMFVTGERSGEERDREQRSSGKNESRKRRWMNEWLRLCMLFYKWRYKEAESSLYLTKGQNNLPPLPAAPPLSSVQASPPLLTRRHRWLSCTLQKNNGHKFVLKSYLGSF